MSRTALSRHIPGAIANVRSVFARQQGSGCHDCSRCFDTIRGYATAQSISRGRTRPIGQFGQDASRTVNRPRWIGTSSQVRADGKSTAALRQQHDDVPYEAVERQFVPSKARKELSSVTNLTAYLDNAKSKILHHDGIPSEAEVASALRACKVVADYIMDDSVQPQISHMATESDSTASTLLSLDSNGAKKHPPASIAASGNTTGGGRISSQLKQLIKTTSDTAYVIISHQTVFITPSLLQEYVGVQARLGKAESLPQVLQLYASKPMPRAASGSVSFVKQNPNKISNAIDPEVAGKALDTAIEAKDLDVAIAIVESSYTTKAFIRSKLFRRAGLPLATFAAAPVAVWIMASNFSGLQDTMDPGTASNIAFVGILAYVGFTASLGVITVTTANDQMKRVTWAPGIPLHNRWLREEERAALDKIACAWGFQEKWRQGDEEGAEWDALREYVGQRGMILDRVELMEGMN